jgi:hypothetical protein
MQIRSMLGTLEVEFSSIKKGFASGDKVYERIDRWFSELHELADNYMSEEWKDV